MLIHQRLRISKESFLNTILCHRLLLVLTGNAIRNLPHLEMHLLHKTKEKDEERLSISMFYGFKTVQPRRQRSVLDFVLVLFLVIVILHDH